VIYDSSISGWVQIGSQSIVVGVKVSPDSHSNANLKGIVLPGRHWSMGSTSSKLQGNNSHLLWHT
jgi:hypothetical protein